jgi:hypothetical protein
MTIDPDTAPLLALGRTPSPPHYERHLIPLNAEPLDRDLRVNVACRTSARTASRGLTWGTTCSKFGEIAQ